MSGQANSGVKRDFQITPATLDFTPPQWQTNPSVSPAIWGLLLIIDIHTHTYPTSDDSTLTPEELIGKAKRIGLDGVCITDHDRFWTPSDIDALARKHDFLVLPGCEVTTEEGHILVYGLREYIFGMHKASFVKELVDDAGGAMVVAHPYRRFYRKQAHTSDDAYEEMLIRACDNRAFDMTDAVEIRNGRGSMEENLFAEDIAERFGLSGTGASDAHSLAELGTYATRFYQPIRCLDDLIDALKSGRHSAFAVADLAASLAVAGA